MVEQDRVYDSLH